MFTGVTTKVTLFAPQCGQVRHSSGKLKELAIRLKAVKNIQKITKTMKMISAAKFAQASKAIIPARAYGEGALSVYEKANITPSTSAPQLLYVAVASDRGLCGALHTNITKSIKEDISNLGEGTQAKIVTLGEKAKAGIANTHASHMLLEVKELGRIPPSFQDAAAVGDELLTSGYDFQVGNVTYNWFKSAMSQIIKKQPIIPTETMMAAPSLTLYDSVDEDVVRSFQEFQLANTIFYTLKENYTSEQGARMISMDGATKNAGEMIDRMALLYNRTRQAVITTELIEIISGMTAIHG
jgi:F-type H+-transporting ATPase subunit gamma